MRRKNGTDPTGGEDEILIACESVHVGGHLIAEGETYRASDPAVAERPEALFAVARLHDRRATRAQP